MCDDSRSGTPKFVIEHERAYQDANGLDLAEGPCTWMLAS